jgi:tetraprenyl-beta-curcumene synthase
MHEGILLQKSRLSKTPAVFLYKLFSAVLPQARRELSKWKTRARQIPDVTLREQALQSLTHKRFHADGGCVYAAYDSEYINALVSVIIALQTISDYLDNLCDRTGTYDIDDFTQLHHAMRDAVHPGAPLRDYYALRNNPDDNGYLNALVQTCQTVLSSFPGYMNVEEHVAWLVERYCELQAYKHTFPEKRADLLKAWAAPYLKNYPEIHWWEFAAATGSTLGMFALFEAATRPVSKMEADMIFDSYFPWICGLHILLDYLIDLEEDKQEGDFNFIRCYPSSNMVKQRLRVISQKSWKCAVQLTKRGPIHRFVVKGLPGMYLSDRKVRKQRFVRQARKLVWSLGPTTWLFYLACVFYRIVR